MNVLPACTCGAPTHDAGFGATSVTHRNDCALILALYPPRELAVYTETHDGQTEPSAWPPLDEEGFPF